MYPNLNSGIGNLMKNQLATNPTTGRIFIVCKNSLTAIKPEIDSMYGAGYPDGTPIVYDSLTSALSSVVSSRGDVIFMAPGHTENISSAAGIAIAKTGVTIIGLGNGSNRPTFTFDTATTATMTITAANVTIKNCVFTQAFDAIVSPIVISAANVTLEGNYFMVANASFQATQMILTTADANNLVISKNRFIGTADAGTTAAITLVGGDNANIIDNDFIGAYSSAVGAIRSITTANTNCVIRRNTIVNRTASATKGITLLTGSTGVIAENRFGIGSGAVPITADAAWWAGNWSAAAVATNGTLV